MLQAGLQTAVAMIYPPRCLTCGDTVDTDFGLCATCWKSTEFIGGAICDTCGIPLPGSDLGDVLQCDDCMQNIRPWGHGRAALVYKDTGRKLVLALKHGDRQEIARPAAIWMATVARKMMCETTLVAPVPLHWMRLLRRRFNQSALLAKALAYHTGHQWCPDLLTRNERTKSLDHMGHADRYATLENAILANSKRRHRMAGRNVLLVDDVMTSGATLAACTKACLDGGAASVNIVTLARVAKDT